MNNYQKNKLILKPTYNLLDVFENCHNYIYANEGLLKDKIFNEIVKIIFLKLYDEKAYFSNYPLRFYITDDEYKKLLFGQLATDFLKRINSLFEEVKNKYPLLFFKSSITLKPLTLAYVVKQLQNLDLTNTQSDIKGDAFQTFFYKYQRGDRGEFFTPHPVVKLAVEITSPKENDKIIDPACGSGGFLIQVIRYVCDNNHLNKQDYIKKCIRGIEFNPDISLSAVVRIIFEGGTGNEIICANSLLSETQDMHEMFDIVLTNPPFGSKGKIKDFNILCNYELGYQWKKTQDGKWTKLNVLRKNQTPEILFIEKSLKLLRPGGKMAIVLPDGILQNITNGYVRQWIKLNANILSVISLPQETFIPFGTGIKTSLLILQKHPSAIKKVFMAQINQIGYDVKGQPIYKKDNNGRFIKDDKGNLVIETDIDVIINQYKSFKKQGDNIIESETIFTVNKEMLNLRFDVEHYKPQDIQLVKFLNKINSKPIKELADILKEADNFRINSDEIKYIAISDVNPHTMTVVSMQKIKAFEAPSRATYRLKKGDIITAISGANTGTPLHATAYITEDEDGAICSNGFAVIRNVREINPYYLLAFMKTELFWKQVRRLMTGHAIPAISLDDLSNVLVPILPKHEQEKISRTIQENIYHFKRLQKETEKVIYNFKSLINEKLNNTCPVVNIDYLKNISEKKSVKLEIKDID